MKSKIIRISRILLTLLIVCSLSSCFPSETSAPEPTSAATLESTLAPTSAASENTSSTVTETELAPEPGELLTVHFIDVGQADSALIQCGGQTALIDGGNVEDSSLLISYLNKLSIDFLDYMICSHAHEDHVGGLSAPLSVIGVGAVYAPKTESDSSAYATFKSKAAGQGLDIIRPSTGDKLSIGNCSLEFFAPTTENPDDLNNTSIMCKVSYGNTSFLFTGDAEREEELDIIDQGCDLNADILKVGHHGSVTSTSYIFLREVAPKYAVISVGKGNGYGHPTEEALSRLRDAGVQTFRTDMQGDIIAESDGENISLTPSRNPDARTNPTEAESGDDSGMKSYHNEGGATNVSGGEVDGSEAETVYIGNINTKKFHLPTCHSLPMEKNRIYVNSREEIVNMGYSACGNCRP